MSTRLIALALAGAVLVLPGSAVAKELTMITICGRDDCHSTHDHSRLAALPVGGTPTDPPEAASFFRVNVHMRAGRPGSFRMYFLPRERLLRETPEHGSWVRVEPAPAAALSALAEGLDPFPATELRYARARLPDATAAPIATPAPRAAMSAGGGFPWLIALLAGLGLAVAVSASRLVVRRRGPSSG